MLLGLLLLLAAAFVTAGLSNPAKNSLTNPATPVAIGGLLALVYSLNRTGRYVLGVDLPVAGVALIVAG
jgi:hypothetical protein